MNNDNMYQKIIDCYILCQSVKKTAERLGTYPIKVRRVLITEGLWSSRTSEKIGRLFMEGYSVPQIAEALVISEKNVQSYLPYTRGAYGGNERSSDALRSEEYRRRMTRVANKQVIKGYGESGGIDDMDKMILGQGNKRPYALKLRLELDIDDISQEEMSVLKRYGKVVSGINREFIIPGDMTLHALHYAINKAFGWQNSHLHSFHSSAEDFDKMTNGDRFADWAKLAGIYFRFPSDDFEDIYWDDDYREGVSFKSWLKKKYKGPYYYGGKGELYDSCQAQVESLYNHFDEIEVRKPFGLWYEESKALKEKTGNEEVEAEMIEKVVPINQVTISELMSSISFEGGFDELLERLAVADLLLKPGAKSDWDGASFDSDRGAVPLLDRIRYWYDYGDNWNVQITCLDWWESEEALVEDGYESEKINLLLPVCTLADGLNVLDDVGGLSGYCRMLEALHGDDVDERESYKVWARGMGWTGRRRKASNVL